MSAIDRIRQRHASAPAPRQDDKAQALPIAPDPFRPFPADALPAPIAAYVAQGSQALGCDPTYLALPALGTAAGLIGYTRVLALKRTWRVPAVLWPVVIAESGSLKTPAFRLSEALLFDIQRRLDANYKRELVEHEQEKQRRKASEDADDKTEPEAPTQATIFTSDCTIEALAGLIEDNPRGLLVACDELAGWLGSFARYKGKGGGTDLPRWLSMHSAAGFAYNRKTGDRRRIVIPHAAVSVIGGIQPGIFARVIADDFIAAGLAARLLPAMPPRPAKQWTETEIDPATEDRYRRLLDALYELSFDRRDGKNVPHVVRLSRDAKAAWIDWYNAWGRKQATVEGELAAAFSKLEEATARLALVHWLVTRLDAGKGDLDPLELSSIEAGIRMVEWFAYESQRVYALLGESEEQYEARRLLDFIRHRGGQMTPRDLQRANGKKYRDVAAAELALDGLVAADLGQWIAPSDGKRISVFRLRPTSDNPTNALDGSPIQSDKPSDNSKATRDIPAENGTWSDLSDCRTGSQEGKSELKPGKAIVGRNGHLSDGGGYVAPDLSPDEIRLLGHLDREAQSKGRPA